MNILMFHQSSDLYGSDRVFLDIVIGLASFGYTPIVLIPENGVIEFVLNENDIEYHVLNVVKISRSSLSFRGLASMAREAWILPRGLKKILAGRTVDIVYSNTLATFGGAVFSLVSKKSHIWHVHEIIEHPRILSKMYPWFVYLFSNIVIANSSATAAWLVAACTRLKKSTRLVPNGVTSYHRKEDPYPYFQNGFPSRTFRIGLVGRINRLKGHAVLVRAVAHAAKLCTIEFEIHFFGDTPPGQDIYLSNLIRLIEKEGMRDKVVFHGFTKDVQKAYEAVDIVCVPSTEPESFGLVAAESMLSRRPVIASKIGALASLISNESTGLLFEPGDYEQLAENLIRLATDSGLYNSLSVQGADYISKNYSTSAMVEKIESAIVQLMSESKHAGNSI